MVKVNIPAKFDLPESIEVRLVREDVLETSNIFRVLFEIVFALFAGICGAYITLNTLVFIHWLLFSLLLILSALFFVLWIVYYRKSKVHQVSTDSKLNKFPFRVVGFLANINLNDVEVVTNILKELNIKNEAIYWHTNKIKTQFKTVRITEITNELLAELIEKLKGAKVDYIDEKIEI